MRTGSSLELALAALLPLFGFAGATFAGPLAEQPRVAAEAAPRPLGGDVDETAWQREDRAPSFLVSGLVLSEPPPRFLRLERLGTRDRIELIPFAKDGTPRSVDMEKLTLWFSPAGTPKGDEDAVPPDPRLVELLLRISAEVGGEPLILVSGHRRPGRGTSRKSYHVRGMAADIAVQGLKPIELRKAAIKAGALGVGLYPGFVHVDARTEPYQWSGGGRRRR